MYTAINVYISSQYTINEMIYTEYEYIRFHIRFVADVTVINPVNMQNVSAFSYKSSNDLLSCVIEANKNPF